MSDLGEDLLAWYEEEGRKNIPWRGDPNPYHIWVSEVMAQQTRLEVVKKYYLNFIQVLPDIESLAKVGDDDLVRLWEGLGYYSRAHNMKKAAIQVMEEYGGRLPASYDDLVQLPGIGPYTGAAIASIAFNQDLVAMDGNAYRVASRLTQEEGEISRAPVKRRLKAKMEEVLVPGRAGDFNQAVMDLGSMVCQPRAARCQACPLRPGCLAGKGEDPLAYPKKAKKKARPKDKKSLLILDLEGSLLLERRPDQGLLSRMWAFPLVDSHDPDQITAYLAQEFPNLKVTDWKFLGNYRHIFSHREWLVHGFYIWVKYIGKDFNQAGDGFKKADRVADPSRPYGLTSNSGGKADLAWKSWEEIDQSVGLASVFRYFFDQIPYKEENKEEDR